MDDLIIKRNWTGKWIEPEQEPAWHTPELDFSQMVEAEGGTSTEASLRCAKHLRREVEPENENGELPVSAIVHASAHGVYDLYINGKKADDRLLAPETTNYKKLIWYQDYDITDLIEGSDRLCIDVLLGDGWWIGRLGMAGSSCNYGDRLGFIMDLELVYPDGSERIIGSDETFLSCDSFIRYSDLYIGEMQDGRVFDYIDAGRECGFMFSDSPEDQAEQIPDWTNCKCADYPTDVLALQVTEPVQVVREIPLCSYVENSRNELVADFGQVLAGVVRIRVNAEPGTLITLEHGEVLDKEGNYFSNIKGLYKDQKTQYLCAGGEQTFVPHFTYQGFRYVRISGLEKAEILELTALVYGTPIEKLAEFETDHELLNGLQTAIENSTVSNMISVPTDCPQREKLGWTGDINIFTGTGAFLYDLRNMLTGWLLQVRLDQFPDGEIPCVVPDHPSQERMQRGMSGGTDSSAAWSDCIVFMPLRLYEIYGDESFLSDNYDAMEKWMAYVQSQAGDCLWTGRFHFGDWLIPSLREEPDGIMKGVQTTADIVGSCYYSLAAGAMAEVCHILGYAERSQYYRNLQELINEALVRVYVFPDGRVGVNAAGDPAADDPQLQGLYVVMLKTGAVKEPELKAAMLSRLVSLIEESGYTLDCGFASIGFLLDVLYDNGYKEAAYKILFNTKAPSWLYMIKRGATAIWENWRAIKEDGTVTDSSYNHYAYGCVGEFLYRHIGGLEVLEPGFKKVRIAPDLDCGIRKSICSRKMPGTDKRILVSWELDEDSTSGEIYIEIPACVTAILDLPGNSGELEAGSYTFRINRP